jgi:hypothetical protein
MTMAGNCTRPLIRLTYRKSAGGRSTRLRPRSPVPRHPLTLVGIDEHKAECVAVRQPHVVADHVLQYV